MAKHVMRPGVVKIQEAREEIASESRVAPLDAPAKRGRAKRLPDEDDEADVSGESELLSEFEFVDELPTKRKVSKYEPLVAKLKKSPGNWAAVRTFDAVESAASMATQLRNLGLSASIRTLRDGDDAGKVKLFARYENGVDE